MDKENKPKSRRENIVVQEFDDEVLIYDLERDRAFCLNKTSAVVWRACNGMEPGTIQIGMIAGAGAPVSLVSPTGCLGVTLAELDDACNSLRRDNCCSFHAAFTVGSCTPASGGQIDFTCTCVPL